MGWLEAIKEGISIAQKANNIPLVSVLIEAQKQILDLIHENEELRKENDNLKLGKDISDKIVRHKDAYITLKDDEQELVYCSRCYDIERKLVQGQTNEEWGKYWCPACNFRGYYSKETYEYAIKKQEEQLKQSKRTSRNL